MLLKPTSSGRITSYVCACEIIPCWWMPDSWAKAFCPTTALLRATWNPVAPETTRLTEQSCWVRIPVRNPKRSCRVRRAITTSSSEQFPARSPMPLMVHST